MISSPELVFYAIILKANIFRVVCVLILIAKSNLGLADVLKLKDGASVSGSIIKENDTSLMVDLGFDILRVPKNQILSREKSTKAKKGDALEAMSDKIYSRVRNLPTRSVRELVKEVGPATVQVRTSSGLGSGFIISPEGYVISNNHVISGDYKLTVVLYEQGERELRKVTFDKVELLAQSPLFDLALLKIHAERDFPFVPLAQSNALEQGQEVFAVGSPLGLERTVSQGIVSVRNRVVESGMTLIQHTAQINSGNSGGPLFNRQGEVVGVNNLKIASSAVEGIAFAIPTATVVHFLENRDAYGFDPRNPNSGYRYLSPAGSVKKSTPQKTHTQ